MEAGAPAAQVRPAAERSHEDASMLRLISANLRHGRADAGRFAELVREADADVVAVQELGPELAEVLAALLPHGKLEPTPDGMGMGVALRRPGAVERLPLPHRDAIVARLAPAEWPGLREHVEVMNVHISAPHTRVPQSWRDRRGQVAGLEAYLAAASGPRVLVGDLNATPAWPAYRRLASWLDDAALSVAAREGRAPARTWGPGPGTPRLLRIDHVLSDALEVHALRVVSLPGSDHSAVVVDVAL
jgi:endonuclease/exonuclease/phosphatase family metal-dependent hydrolase